MTTRAYSAKSDVYSIGVLLWEIYSGGRTPFAELAIGEVVRAVLAGARLPRPSAETPQDIMAIIRACTALEVASRPNMARVFARLSGTWTLADLASSGNDNQHARHTTLQAPVDDEEDSETLL